MNQDVWIEYAKRRLAELEAENLALHTALDRISQAIDNVETKRKIQSDPRPFKEPDPHGQTQR